MKKQVILITGGCRSGKSAHALELARRYSGGERFFLATCVAEDDEMRDRVARHQKERGRGFVPVECPVHLDREISRAGRTASVILVDCLTLWTSNLMLAEGFSLQSAEDAVQSLETAMIQAPCSVILVTNEVGCGIVPENRPAREFRDLVGMVNRRVAAVADSVVWMVAGIPVVIKGKSS